MKLISRILALFVGLGAWYAARSATLLDPSFRLDDRVQGQFDAITVQADGKMLVAGTLTLPDLGTVHVVRLKSDGTLDPSFGHFRIPHFIDEFTTMALLVLPDGRIWVRISKSNWVGGGGMSTDPIFFRSVVYVANRDGGVPDSWGQVPALVQPTLLSNGKVLLWGTQSWFEGTGSFRRAYLELRTVDGTVDSSLTIPPGIVDHYWGELNQVTVCLNGDWLLAGEFPRRPFPNLGEVDWLVRLSPQGQVRWRNSPPLYNSASLYAAEDTSGEIVVVGEHPSGMARYGGDGTLRLESYRPPAFLSGDPSLLLHDGRMLVFGNFNAVQGLLRPKVVALASDGSIDLAFNPGAGFASGAVIRDVVQQPDGRCLVIGEFNTFDGRPCRGVIRLLNADPDLSVVPVTEYYMGSRLTLTECGGPVSFEVVRAGSLDKVSRVRVSTVSSSAMAGDDFVPLHEVVTFSPGERSRFLFLTPLIDKDRESDEVLYLQFSGVDEPIYGPGILDNPVVIRDVECPAPEGELRVAVTEGQSYRGALGEGTWRTSEDAQNARVRIIQGSAVPEKDYRITMSLNSTLSPVVDFEVVTLANTLMEGSRQLRLELYDGRNGGSVDALHTNGYHRAEITILDDDVPVVVPSVVDGPIYGFAATEGGSMLVKGTFGQFGRLPQRGLVRLKSGGEEDSTFNARLGGMLDARAVLPLKDDRLWVGGFFTEIQGRSRPGFARLMPDGSVDDSFLPIGDFEPPLSCRGTTTSVEAIAVAPDDELWLLRNWIPNSECNLSAMAIQRVSASGELLQTTPLPPEASPQISLFESLPDGSLVFQAGVLGRLHRSGSLSIFGTNQSGVSTLLSTGEILSVPGNGAPIVWRGLDGSVVRQQDHVEVEGTRYFPVWIRGILAQADGAAVITGTFSDLPGSSFGANSWILRLNRDGTVPPGLACRLPGPPNYGAPAVSASGEWYVAMEGENGSVPRWLRLGSDWKLVRDLRIHRVVPSGDGRVYLEFQGQALGGFAVESSEDLLHWRPEYITPNAFTGQVFSDLWPDELPGVRYYRVP